VKKAEVKGDSAPSPTESVSRQIAEAARLADAFVDGIEGWDQAIYNRFTKVIYEKSGIALGSNKYALVSARVGKRMRALGMKSPREYLRFAVADGNEEELIQLLDVISTNVTSFFREPDHFDFLADLMEAWQREGQRRFRFWSAACSTGEEPYSMAMTLLEALGAHNVDLKILATDISTRVLAACNEGVYEAEKLAGVREVLRERYFERINEGKVACFSAKGTLRSRIVFRRLNLSRPPFPMKGPFDVVFCRNVMIYFDSILRSELIQEIHRLLKPGGILMVGHSESLAGVDVDLKLVRPSIYIKA
jgi:chemotaxis protein methyltransferase CheR